MDKCSRFEFFTAVLM